MRLSCAVRAHPHRRDLVDALLQRLDLSDEHVVWDEKNDSWNTGARAWQAHDPDADWHLVIEDDAVVCRDLLAGVTIALERLPLNSVASLYLGNRTSSREIGRAADWADREKAPWVQARTLVWGVAIAAPVASIPGMLTWCNGLTRYDSRVYDTRIARYYAEILQWPAYYTWPSLVDHRQVPSLLRGGGEGRRAIGFIGEDASALEVDWSGEAIDSLRRNRRSKEFADMPEHTGLLVARKSAVIYHNGRRTTIQKGVTIAEAGADLVREHKDLWEPLVVHYPASKRAPVEMATAAPGEKRDLPLPSRREIREWAQANGYEVSPRGPLSAEVIEEYRKAHPEDSGD